MRCREGLTTGWPPSGGDAVWKNACCHHSVELRLPHLRLHPFLVVAGFGGLLPWLRSSLPRRHFLRSGLRMKADARVDVDWETQELRRKMIRRNGKGGGVGCGGTVIKHFPHLSAYKGFWETVLVICATPISPTLHMGRYLGFHVTATHIAHLSPPSVVIRQIIADFSAIYRGSMKVTV